MKVAVIGTGKSGSALIEQLDADNVVGPFNSKNTVTVEALDQADVAICFVPGNIVNELVAPLFEWGKPVLWASTGNQWPDDLSKSLEEKNITWITSTNFSLGIMILRNLISKAGKLAQQMPNAEISIHEIHHTKKQDSPSGTALSWKEWLNIDCPITSQRLGDVKGIHELTIENEYEKISIVHESKDRALFAKGALWGANKLLSNDCPAGLVKFETLFDLVANK